MMKKGQKKIILFVTLLLVITFCINCPVSAFTSAVVVTFDTAKTSTNATVKYIKISDIANPAISKVTQVSTTGDSSDIKTLLKPTFGTLSRSFTTPYSQTSNGVTVEVIPSAMPDVDISGSPDYNVYIQSVVPTINTVIPGQTGDVIVTKYNDSFSRSDADSTSNLYNILQNTYIYSTPGLLYISNPQATGATACGVVDSKNFVQNNVYLTLFNNSVSLANFNAKQSATYACTLADPTTLPVTGKYFAIMPQQTNANDQTLYLYGANPLVILPANTDIYWNGAAMTSTPVIYDKSSGASVTFALTGGTGSKNLTYLILNKDVGYDLKMYFNTTAMAETANNNWQALLPSEPIYGALKSSITSGVSADPFIYTYHFNAQGAAEGTNATTWSGIGITDGYGISGNQGANSLTITAADLNTLIEGNYYVYGMGTDENNNVIAIDQKYLTITGTSKIPITDFTANTTRSETAPVWVQFTDTSQNTPKSWSWDFGDGNTSTLQNPVNKYRQGIFNVTLTATNAYGSNTTTKSNYIQVGKYPIVSYSYTPTTIQVNDTVSFDATASIDPDGTINEFKWDFGDGNITKRSTGQYTITHIYNRSQVFNVTLTLTDNDLFTNSTMQQLAVIAKIENSNTNINGSQVSTNADGKQQIIVNETNCNGTITQPTSTSLVITNPGNGWQEATYVSSVPITHDDGNFNLSSISQVILQTTPVSAVLNESTVGTVSTGVKIPMTQMPTGVTMTQTVVEGANTSTRNSFQLAATNNNLNVSAVAYTVEFSNAAAINANRTAASDPIELNMSVLHSWVTANAQNGDRSKIKIMHIKDDGTNEMLTTSYTGSSADGLYDFFKAQSSSLSIFGVTAVSSTGGGGGGGGGSTGGGGGGGGGGSSSFTGLAVTYGVPPKPGLTEALITKSTPVTKTGIVESGPIVADLVGIEGVSAAWTVDITQQPAAGAMLTSSIIQQPSTAVKNAYRYALQSQGLDVAQIAYVMQVTKTGITSTGPATIQMDIPQVWVNDYGGMDKIRIVRQADDGTPEVLTTKFSNYDMNTGYLNFVAASPKGLSTFGLVATKTYVPGVETPVPPPGVTITPSGNVSPTGGPTGGLPVTTIIGVVIVLAIIGLGILIYIRKHE